MADHSIQKSVRRPKPSSDGRRSHSLLRCRQPKPDELRRSTFTAGHAERAKTVRLKALRLAKEAADKKKK